MCYRQIMATFSRSLALVVLVLATRGVAGASCTSNTCTDVTAVDTTRSLVAAACDCAGAKSHGKYVKCAKQILKSSIKDGTLPRVCKRPVLGCEAQSTCGRPNAKICCAVKDGKVKAKAIFRDKCTGGNICEDPMSLADACTNEGTCRPRQGLRSFRSIQKVFSQSCALPTCHSTVARQGGLVLDSEDVSYASLVNHAAAHPQAQGMLRVKPGDPASSFLIRKLRAQGPGDPMPQTGEPLPDPVIGMIEDWIQRGALSTADECKGSGSGTSLCDDSGSTGGDYHWQPLAPLDPPAPNEGIQLHLPPRDVPSGTEWEMCYAFKPDWSQISANVGLSPGGLPAIREQVYRMHPGSHHLLLYAYFGAHPEVWPTDRYFPCIAANCINDADCPPDAGTFTLPIGGTQVAGTRYTVQYPEGVGIPVLSSNMVLIANPHYTNPFIPAQDIYGEEWLNLYFYPQGGLKAILDGIFAINFRDLFVEPYQTRTISSIWQPHSILGGGSTDAAIFQLFGHMHKRATEFRIDYVRGGTCSVNVGKICGNDADCACKPYQQNCVAGQTCVRVPNAEDTTIYYTQAWDQAPIMDFPAPYFRVAADEGLRWTCTHTNGIEGDPNHPPKKCGENCSACGWDAASRTCIFTRGVSVGIDTAPRVYNEGDPMPLVFGQLADDDMCNMFGYFIKQSDLSSLP